MHLSSCLDRSAENGSKTHMKKVRSEVWLISETEPQVTLSTNELSTYLLGHDEKMKIALPEGKAISSDSDDSN